MTSLSRLSHNRLISDNKAYRETRRASQSKKLMRSIKGIYLLACRGGRIRPPGERSRLWAPAARRRTGYTVGATSVGALHSLNACCSPQSRNRGFANCAEHQGQTAPVAKVSKGWPHFPQRHSAPEGGDVLQLGQENSCRRGNFAMRRSSCACLRPPQQFRSMKAASAPYQIDCIHSASPMNPATPMNPRMVATCKLRARPRGNQRSDRRIWPPSSG